ncbi:hypothetical protein AWC38_SpisGene7907 [Stylophora pistillata]|uniref:Reverse transcriptase domain-containing protein n=1 Tax=Stylophora pistillata TaxID=50429 RepID=A0A2B4SF35_STYPI|nr:hypothetical protein AWC38_SpisGene7907 [Stylophora pistillata]
MAEKDKDLLEEQVKELRRKLSIAKAELDMVKKNDAVTRKGRRNRKLLLQECKQDSRWVYSSLREMASEQANKERPKYEARRDPKRGRSFREYRTSSELLEDTVGERGDWEEVGRVVGKDDLKIFAASREKLRRVMVAVRGTMKDIGLEWNKRKCSVAHVKRGTLESEEPCWPIAELKRLGREARKVIVENGDNHPLGSTALVYLPRGLGGRGLKSVEREYKQAKVKAAVRLYTNDDPAMEVVRRFEERSEEMGQQSVVKDAKRYASEFGLNLSLVHPEPLVTCLTNDLKVPVKKIGMWLKTAVKERDVEELKAEGWQGRLLTESGIVIQIFGAHIEKAPSPYVFVLQFGCISRS